jgi:hypothetical protein
MCAGARDYSSRLEGNGGGRAMCPEKITVLFDVLYSRGIYS